MYIWASMNFLVKLDYNGFLGNLYKCPIMMLGITLYCNGGIFLYFNVTNLNQIRYQHWSSSGKIFFFRNILLPFYSLSTSLTSLLSLLLSLSLSHTLSAFNQLLYFVPKTFFEMFSVFCILCPHDSIFRTFT